MREILFRGKRIDNGEWVYGDIIHRRYYKNKDVVVIRTEDSGFDNYSDYEVDPSTVGQCVSNLTDRNGKKIFEGDIVEYPIELGKYSKQNIHEVVFERRHGTAYFGIKMSDIETWGFDLTVPAKLMKVIGNIHDNPELLEDKL